MHRSGTSLACQLLDALGVPFGDESDRLATDRWNPQGYFERRSVVDLNSRIVTGFPRTQSRFAALLSKLAYAKQPPAAAIEARARAQRPDVELLAARYAACAVKDPRFCLTLRFWDAALRIDRILVCLREPGAVVASLRRRDRLPSRLGYRFWAWHMEALLQQLPLDRAVFVETDRLAVGDGRELECVRQFLGLASSRPADSVLRSVVRPDALRSGEARSCPPRVSQLWAKLRELAEQRRQSIMGHAR